MATLLPTAKQSFTDSTGAPLVGGKLYTYAAGTTTLKDTYQDAAGTILNTNPIVLDSRGECIVFWSGSYKVVLKDAAGVTVWTIDNVASPEVAGTAATLRADLLDAATASKGGGMVGYSPSVAYPYQSIGGALNDGAAELIWFVTSEVERAAIKAGTSTTDHTSLIQSAMTAVGARELNFGPKGWVWNISGTLNGVSGQTLRGKAKIKAKSASAMLHMIRATSLDNFAVYDLELDGNADTSGSTGHAVYFSDGSNNRAIGLYIHDTYIAGIRAEAEDDIQIMFNRVINCGRVGPSDNHGVMVGCNAATTFLRGHIIGNQVQNAYRKGIAVYCFNLGVVDGLDISHNKVSSCGLGGIYLAADELMTNIVRNIKLQCNQVTDNYVNYEFASVSHIDCVGNDSLYTNVTGKSAGWYIAGCKDINITGGSNDFAPIRAVSMVIVGATGNSGVSIRGMKITRANQLNDATGVGVYMSDSSNCIIDCDISDSTGLMRHGVLEFTGCTNNKINAIGIRDATTALVTLQSGSTASVVKDQERRVAATYSTSITLNNLAGGVHEIIPTDAVAFTLNPFSNPVKGHVNIVRVKNTTGGVLGAMNTPSIKMPAWVQPATGFSRALVLEFNGTSWVEVSRSAADIPN